MKLWYICIYNLSASWVYGIHSMQEYSKICTIHSQNSAQTSISQTTCKYTIWVYLLWDSIVVLGPIPSFPSCMLMNYKTIRVWFVRVKGQLLHINQCCSFIIQWLKNNDRVKHLIMDPLSGGQPLNNGQIQCPQLFSHDQ